MSRQQEFDFGIPIPPLQPKRPDRVFFALFLQARDRAAFWSLQRHLCDLNGITGTLLLKERFHITQQHVGDYKRLRSKIEFAAKRAGRMVEMPAFEVTFSHAVSFPGRPAAKGRPPSRPFVLLADDGPVCELSRLIGIAMKANGLKSADHFVPHMTIAYDEKFVPRQPIEPIGFVAREFVLIHSLRGLTIYKDLSRWPLMAASS
ncbi:2'-5' RNA ligase [Mesorhizobium sp. CA18]|uniref:2'-5' RNA ligase family protein n=1 Tax=unclassified Mesorhizobium TaxID=325217 RepID=UPI001CCDCB17|nr:MULTISPECIES: 2'-5' RNA ligase family protein [unclassified Mesorhizobium]MBZ9733155.1 2'-5' RNA ligase [Mesorhizobium sp. CA9]MBZ9826057.1 2'-5' RNA ligase [Mesorhizobium sp. CA18]MBZ9830990.1 2'-5' RNA ligase [Mesorhizobium sp. CA2]MBZ9835335.1 2'-5' RNA ligase [Mesorhizobium sp. CA3]MBZ9875981.1 2'-5' RNA ligase [Mesorhizobium sp. Ca11]